MSRLRLGLTGMNMKLARVFAVAGLILFVFLGLYAWNGLRYLVRRVVMPKGRGRQEPIRIDRPRLRPPVLTPHPTGHHSHKAAA